MPGGIFQLIAYGAQDLYLTGNNFYDEFEETPKIYQPKSLEKYAFKSLTEGQKTFVYNNCHEVFVNYTEKIQKKQKGQLFAVLSEMKYFLLGYTKHKNKAILKAKEIYVQAEKEAIERYTKIKNYMKQVKHEKLKRERVEMLKSKTKEIRDNRVLHKIQMESESDEEMEFFDFFN